MSKRSVAIGLRAARGGATVVAVTVDAGVPCVVLSTFVATGAEGDRLSIEPFHVAAELPRSADGTATPEARAVVTKGRATQDALALAGLKAIASELDERELSLRAAHLLVNRAGWMNDLLAYSLMDPGHPPVAEGLAVRDALRAALRAMRLEPRELDEKTLVDVGSRALRLSTDVVEDKLKALGATVGRPWRKEQKLACLAAWMGVVA